MKYDFDREINRIGTHAAKWEVVKQGSRFVPVDEMPQDPDGRRVLPMWLADMDFACPQPVIDALVARTQHGIFGYNWPGPSYRQAVIDWMARRHGWLIAPEWIVATPGVVPALNMLVRTFVAPGQRVVIRTLSSNGLHAPNPIGVCADFVVLYAGQLTGVCHDRSRP